MRVAGRRVGPIIRCTKCLTKKPRDQFYLLVDGRECSWCKECHCAHYKARYHAKRAALQRPQEAGR